MSRQEAIKTRTRWWKYTRWIKKEERNKRERKKQKGKKETTERQRKLGKKLKEKTTVPLFSFSFLRWNWSISPGASFVPTLWQHNERAYCECWGLSMLCPRLATIYDKWKLITRVRAYQYSTSCCLNALCLGQQRILGKLDIILLEVIFWAGTSRHHLVVCRGITARVEKSNSTAICLY